MLLADLPVNCQSLVVIFFRAGEIALVFLPGRTIVQRPCEPAAVAKAAVELLSLFARSFRRNRLPLVLQGPALANSRQCYQPPRSQSLPLFCCFRRRCLHALEIGHRRCCFEFRLVDARIVLRGRREPAQFLDSRQSFTRLSSRGLRPCQRISVIEIVGEEVPERAVEFHRVAPFLVHDAIARFNRQPLFSRQLAGKVKGLLPFLFGLFVITKRRPRARKSRVRKRVIRISRNRLLQKIASAKRVKSSHLCHTLRIEPRGISIRRQRQRCGGSPGRGLARRRRSRSKLFPQLRTGVGNQFRKLLLRPRVAHHRNGLPGGSILEANVQTHLSVGILPKCKIGAHHNVIAVEVFPNPRQRIGCKGLRLGERQVALGSGNTFSWHRSQPLSRSQLRR